ncbi:MAG: hypothetical protein R3260_11470 [Pseudomonas sp.]|nr:hypothetical protein [Pseudomonas sp.]
MDLEFTIRINARQLPFETYKKIRKVISWQMDNKSNSPFEKAKFCRSLDGNLCPSFIYPNFCEHNSADSANDEASFFEKLENELINNFGFNTRETRAIDLNLSNASNEFNKIIKHLDNIRTSFFISEYIVIIIFDHHEEIDSVDGLDLLW